MAVFYHVSTDIRHTGIFEPRIPSCRHQEAEDSTTPRISVAPSIEDCFTAIPNGGSRLDELNIEQRGYYRIFKIDTEKIGITNDQLVMAEELFEKDWVRDADVTNEHWITVPITVPDEDQFIIKLIDWEETSLDIIPHAIYKLADDQYEGDYLTAYMEVYQEHVPCSVGITDVNYICEDVKAEQEVRLYFDDDFEKDMVQEFLEEHYEKEMEIEDETMDELVLSVKKDCNLRKVFFYHEHIVRTYS